MAPRTRTRNTKVLKENIDLIRKTKAKSDGKVTKPPRKALADKTNSLSDDNASIDVPIKTSKVALKNKAANTVTDNGARPRRDRRLPKRYVENQVLSNLSNNKDDSSKNQVSTISVPDPSPVKALLKTEKAKTEEHHSVTRLRRNGHQQTAKEPSTIKKPETPKKPSKNVSSSPFKTPSQSLDSSLATNRPKRICRLPSNFEEHSSPNKFIAVQPCHASTPLLLKNPKPKVNHENNTIPSPEKRVTRKNKNNIKGESKNPKGKNHYFSKRANTILDISSSKNKISPDPNNNKGKRILPEKVVSTKSPKKQLSPKENIKVGFAKRLLENNLSFRVFEDRKTENKDDVYEFTFDPNEEPKPQKKKRKRVVQKKSAKPKTVVIKSNYDKNMWKTLESLKSKVKPSQSQNAHNKPSQPETQVSKSQIQSVQQQNLPTIATKSGKIQIIEDIVIKPAAENKSLNYTPAHPVNESAKSIHMSNYASIHVEDIAADFANDTNDLNYSPVNSPGPKTPMNDSENAKNHGYVAVDPKDPLNLQGNTGNISFFDEEPVASSSMNMSVRNPLASPWRVEFNNLPIKWQANTYLKADMTPAVECSFINSEEISKKKHVYTNLVAEEEPLPLLEDPATLKQTSIISFMKEVAERSLKKKRGRSISPTKSNSLFEDTAGDTSKEFGYKTPKKPRKGPVATTVVSNTSNDKSSDKSPGKESSNVIENHENLNEVSNETSNPKENSNQSENSPNKTKKKEKDVTLFGFDDSENLDQENVSPIKNVRHTRVRGLRAKSRVLQEINTLSGPTRAILPVTTKAKLASSEVVEKLYDQMKSADDAPEFPEKQKNSDENAVNDEESSDDDGQSVHLFEDIELVHHMKPHRKSYGKAKKVTFRQRSIDSDTYTEVPASRSSDEDDLGDLTFHMPNVKQKVTKKKKKKPNKNQFSKKEEKEVDEWAAGFNSMCEDIEDFPLVVE